MSQYLDKDGASRIAENFLLKQAEQDAILQNLQFDLKEAEHALVKTIQGPAPLNIRALTRPLDDYMISGKTIQDGTPTPDSPVDVLGCGVMTGNLCNPNLTRYEKTYSPREGIVDYAGGATYLLPIKANITYTVKIHSDNSIRLFRIGLYNEDTPISGTFVQSLQQIEDLPNPTATVKNSNYKYLYIQIVGSYIDQYGLSHVVVNEGSTALPYEPYGYKLPISCGGTTTNVYLGEQSATRRVKKYVFTGEENGTIYSTGTSRKGIEIIGIPGIIGGDAGIAILAICTHYQPGTRTDLWRNTDNGISNAYQNNNIIFYDASYQTVDAFQQFCTQQYQNGTPVTLWYVLATPETAVVNEPLHKIGGYADTISFAQAGVEISTTKGFNTITTDTTVLPSNIEVKGVINNA